MRIIFMGTPEFSVPSLKHLVDQGYNVVAVVTSTDKIGGRGGKKLIESAVKKYAITQDIPVLQPKNLKSNQFLEVLASYKADIQVIVAFRMLPEVVWNMPPMGSINLHASLLPAYRGAAPINWAIINGEKVTGLTTFKLKHEIDTGNIIFQEKIDISFEDTAGSLHDKMMKKGAELVLKTIRAIEAGNHPDIEQPQIAPSRAPKIYHQTCEINFDDDIKNVLNFVRGLSPYPGAWTTFNGKQMDIYFGHIEYATHCFKPGTWITDNKTYLKFACKNGLIAVTELKLSGKRRMDIRSFLNGYKIEVK